MAFSILSVLVAAVVALPGGPPVGMDYLAYDPTTNRVWVPAGNTGNVDVLDVATGKLTAITGSRRRHHVDPIARAWARARRPSATASCG